MAEMDSTDQITLWSPWTATSQTPWIRSYTPSLATISTYHQPPLSFTYHTLLHNPGPFTTNTITYYIQHITYNNPTTYINNPHAQSHGHAGLMQAHADPMQAVMQSHVLSTPISVVCGCASPDPWSELFFPSMTSLFDRLCRHMTWWLCILVQFWLY